MPSGFMFMAVWFQLYAVAHKRICLRSVFCVFHSERDTVSNLVTTCPQS
jgi:hypothetical protein